MRIKIDIHKPVISRDIRNDFHIDDLLSGGNDISTLQQLRFELTHILESAGFILHKLNSNEPSILEHSSVSITLPLVDEIKTLGVCWDPINDHLQYKTQAKGKSDRITKRSVFSTIAQIYDPLGLMSPTIITAKIISTAIVETKIRMG